LQGEQIADVAIEPLGPEVRTGFGIDQLGVDADLRARPLDASFENIAHPQLAADLFGIYWFALVAEGGVAGDHKAAPDARDIGRQVIGNAVGEVFLLRVVAEIGEREHDNRKTWRRER